jgi:hypothetical protein
MVAALPPAAIAARRFARELRRMPPPGAMR